MEAVIKERSIEENIATYCTDKEYRYTGQTNLDIPSNDVVLKTIQASGIIDSGHLVVNITMDVNKVEESIPLIRESITEFFKHTVGIDAVEDNGQWFYEGARVAACQFGFCNKRTVWGIILYVDGRNENYKDVNVCGVTKDIKSITSWKWLTLQKASFAITSILQSKLTNENT